MAAVLTAPSRLPDILRRTAPWTRLMSILMFIGTGLMIIGGMIFGLAMMAGGAAFANGRDLGGAAAVPGVLAASLYVGCGLLNVLPAIFLWRFSVRATAYVAGPTPEALEQALDAQRSYWKFMGIMVIVAVAAAIVFMVIGVIAATLLINKG